TEQHAVSVAIMRDAHMRGVLLDFATEIFRMHAAAVPIDVRTVGLIAINDDLGPEFTQDTRRRFVSGAVSTIDHEAQTFQGEILRERTLGVFDIAAQGILNTDSLSDFLRSGTDGLDFATENEVLDLQFDLVIELVTIGAEKLNPVIVVRIVRRRDND